MALMVFLRLQVLVCRHWQRPGACAPAPTRLRSDWTSWTTPTGASTLRAGWPLLTWGTPNVAWLCFVYRTALMACRGPTVARERFFVKSKRSEIKIHFFTPEFDSYHRSDGHGDVRQWCSYTGFLCYKRIKILFLVVRGPPRRPTEVRNIFVIITTSRFIFPSNLTHVSGPGFAVPGAMCRHNSGYKHVSPKDIKYPGAMCRHHNSKQPLIKDSLNLFLFYLS